MASPSTKWCTWHLQAFKYHKRRNWLPNSPNVNGFSFTAATLFQCSYKPPTHCKTNTEKYFLSNGAFEEQQYTCYYSSSEPIKVVLKKTGFKLNINLVFPTVFIFLGIGLLFAIKCCGHKFGCPSQSQIRRQRQQQDQQQMQMRPL